MAVCTEQAREFEGTAPAPRQHVQRPATHRERTRGLLLDPRRAAVHLAVVVAIVSGLVLAHDAVPLLLRAWVVFAALDFGATLVWLRLSHDTPAEQARVATVPTRGVVLTGSISSTVRLDYDAGTAEKSYEPTRFVRALYRLSFQAPFPYESNQASLEAARERRRLVGLLTEYWLGENIVAPAREIRREPDGRLVFVTELVRGTAPRDIPRAKALLAGLTHRFVEAGLPAWQVASYNPRSVGNLIEREDGSFRIIDLESNLVTPFMSPRVAVRAIRAGLYPSFDEIDVRQLDTYLSANREHIGATLGASRAAELSASAAAYAEAQAAWHASEPRIASRTLRFAFRLIDIPSWIRGIRRLTQGSQQLAESFTAAGITQWESEGRLSRDEAERLRASLALPDVAAATGHLGAHMAISVPLRFPLGSIARSVWTLAMRARGEWMALRSRTSAKSVREIHSLPVALIAAVPGIGTFAYTLAAPLRKQRAIGAIALDQSLRHLSERVYRGAHFDSLTLWMARPVATAERSSRLLRRAPQAAGARLSALGSHAFVAVLVVLGAALLVAVPHTGAHAPLSEADAARDAVLAGALISAIAGLLAFRLFWHTGTNSRTLDDSAGMFLWAGGAILLAGLATDYGLGVHATVFAATADHVNVFPMFTDPSEHLFTIVYVALGLTLVAAFRHEYGAHRASSTYLALGTLAGVALVAASLFEPLEGALPAAQLATGMFLALAFGSRLAEVSAVATAPESDCETCLTPVSA